MRVSMMSAVRVMRVQCACTWVRARGCVHVRAVPAMWAMHAAGQYERAQSVRGLGRAGGLAQTPKKNGR